MLPNPLHPAVVHFPLVLMFLLPFFAVGALWAIRRGAGTRRAWALPLALAAALAASAFVALRTGDAEEDRVEAVVSESAINEHEEAAERFLVLSSVLLLLAATGLIRGDLGKAARYLTVAGSIGVAVVGVQVGAAGGDLVYQHNAARVYSESSPAVAPEEVAREHDNANVVGLASGLLMHARTEQAVHYRAALLVGMMIRNEQQ